MNENKDEVVPSIPVVDTPEPVDVPNPAPSEDAPAQVDTPISTPEPVDEETELPQKFFNGQVVVKDGFREVNGHTWRHISIGDGTEYDLSEADYQDQVNN